MPGRTRGADPGANIRAAAMRTVKLPPAAPPEPDLGPDVTMQRAFLVAAGHDSAKVAELDDATVVRTVQQVMERTQSDTPMTDELMADEPGEDESETLARWMVIAEQVDDGEEAWLVVSRSWPELDAQGTLDVIQALMARLGDDPQAVDEPVDPFALSPSDRRRWMLGAGWDAADVAVWSDEDIEDELTRVVDPVQEDPVPETPLPEPVPVAVRGPQRINPPRRRHAPGRINITDAADDTPPEFRQAMQGNVQHAAPLKTSPPRKASGHKLPSSIDWPRDGRGRRISPEAFAAQQRGE